MSAETFQYEPPEVTDLGSLADITAGTASGQRDIAGNDAHGKT